MLFRMVREIKLPSDWFDASLSFLSTSRRCSQNRSPSRLPVSNSAILIMLDVKSAIMLYTSRNGLLFVLLIFFFLAGLTSIFLFR